MSANPNVLRLAPIAEKAGALYGISPALLLADIDQESGGTEATSSAGARGVSQFIPSTAAEYGVKYGSTQADVESQIYGQAHYLANLGARTNAKSALEGYFGEHGGAGEAYASSVLAKLGEYGAAGVSGGVVAGGQAAATEGTASSGEGGSSFTSGTLLGLGVHASLYVALIIGAVGVLWLGSKTALEPARG